MGLLKRITNGLGRREDGEEIAAEVEAPQAKVMSDMTGSAPAPVAPQPVAPAGRTDAYGRSEQPRAGSDDELEIPAFLRRQVG